MRWVATLLVGALAVAVLSVPIAMAASTAVGNPLVVELFTSQGCSSCPPADADLARLARLRPDALVLDLHVDYWNDLGWRDPFSLPEASARQRSYDSRLGSEVYTPQLVAGGNHQAIGSDRAAVAAALLAAEADRAVRPPVAVSLSDQGGRLSVDVAASLHPRARQAQLWLVGYDDRHETSIGRGENAGLTETEVDIVRSIRPVADWSGAPLHLHLARPAGQRVAVLLQEPGGRILGAARLADAGT